MSAAAITLVPTGLLKPPWGPVGGDICSARVLSDLVRLHEFRRCSGRRHNCRLCARRTFTRKSPIAAQRRTGRWNAGRIVCVGPVLEYWHVMVWATEFELSLPYRRVNRRCSWQCLDPRP